MEPAAEKAEIRKANSKAMGYNFDRTQPEPTDREKAIEYIVRRHFESFKKGPRVGSTPHPDFIPEHDSKSRWPTRISAERMTAAMPKPRPPFWVNQALSRIRARGEEGPPIGPLEIIEELKSMRKEWGDNSGESAQMKAEEERIRAELEEWDAETAEALRNPDRSQKEIAADSKRIRSEKEKRRTTSKNGGKSKKRTGRLHKKYKKKTNKRRTHRK
jgi:hypothetical protein